MRDADEVSTAMTRERPGSRQLDERTWQTRFAAAQAALDDADALVQLSRRVEGMHQAAAARALLLAGETQVHAVHRIGLFAGSFNPLTDAHVAVASAARSSLQLDLVLWTLASVTIDKERVERASLPDRITQLSVYAALDASGAVALTNQGLYVDQAAALRQVVAHGAQLVIVVGFDKIIQLFDPRYYEDRTAALDELFELADMAVVPRSGEGERELWALLHRPENEPYAPHVRSVDVPSAFATASSTAARALAALGDAGRPRLRTLLPPEGMALVQTGAYAQAPAPDADVYGWRERWMRTLAALSGDGVPRGQLPPLSTLVARTLASDLEGMRLRAWVTGPHDGTDAPSTDELAHLLGA
jgi:nicotinic acid mononucleotide adenylyltransferase